MPSNTTDNKANTLELSPEIAEGFYTNFTSVIATSTEFTLDFVQILPGIDKAKVKARVILTPHTAKGLLSKLQESVANYEKSHNDNQEDSSQATNPTSSKGHSKEVMSYPLGGNVVGEA